MKLAWGAKVSLEFRQKVFAIGGALGCDPSWLMACMAFETGRTFSPSVKNSGSSATGLIQFMAATALDLGTTVEELASMSAEDQLSYVYAYFKKFAGRIASLGDCYMAILYPVAVGQADDFVLFADRSAAYAANKGLDFNHDGVVTRGECVGVVQRVLEEGLRPGNVTTDEQVAAPIEERSKPAPEAPQQEAPMGASLVTGLIASLLQSFAPLAQTKLNAELNRHTDAGTADQVTQGLMNIILQMTGHPEPAAATDPQKIAAVAQVQANPALLKEVEKTALQKFQEAEPWLDKIAQMELQQRTIQITAMDAAARRAQGEKWDMTPQLVYFAGGTATVVVLGLLGIIIAQSLIGDGEINTALIGLAGPLLAISMGVWREIFAYRFDGTKDSAAQNAAIAAVAMKDK